MQVKPENQNGDQAVMDNLNKLMHNMATLGLFAGRRTWALLQPVFMYLVPLLWAHPLYVTVYKMEQDMRLLPVQSGNMRSDPHACFALLAAAVRAAYGCVDKINGKFNGALA